MEGKRKSTPSFKQVRAFATDLYEYIWTKYKFCSPDLEKKFAEQLSLKLLETDDMENSPFNEDIGKAVLCSQYLLRDLCLNFFKRMEKSMFLSKSSFIYCVYLTQYFCRDFRNNIFLRFIDACTIIAEAFLFSDKAKFPRDLYEAPEMLITLFELQISKTFFEKGGWPQLQKEVVENYSSIHLFLTIYTTKFKDPYECLPHNCKITQFLRDSPVSFPVHFSKMCGKCIMDSDEETCFSFDTEYPIEEFIEQYSLELPPLEQDKIKDIFSENEAGKDNMSSLVNSKSYVFLGSNKVNAESFIVKETKKNSKKRKAGRTPPAGNRFDEY